MIEPYALTGDRMFPEGERRHGPRRRIDYYAAASTLVALPSLWEPITTGPGALVAPVGGVLYGAATYLVTMESVAAGLAALGAGLGICMVRIAPALATVIRELGPAMAQFVRDVGPAVIEYRSATRKMLAATAQLSRDNAAQIRGLSAAIDAHTLRVESIDRRVNAADLRTDKVERRSAERRIPTARRDSDSTAEMPAYRPTPPEVP